MMPTSGLIDSIRQRTETIMGTASIAGGLQIANKVPSAASKAISGAATPSLAPTNIALKGSTNLSGAVNANVNKAVKLVPAANVPH
jgi:hypothetical protein